MPLAAVALAGTTSAVAVAALDGPPDVEQVAARIVFERVRGTVRICENRPGGAVVLQRATATGTATGDRRLSGRAVLRTRALLEFSDQNLVEGHETGALRILEPGTRRWKARGTVQTADVEEINQGIVVGRVRDPARPGAGRQRLLAGLRVTFLPNGAIIAQLGGGVPDGRLPAVVSSGRCVGEDVPFDTELPAPPADPYAPGERAPGRWAP